MENKFYVYIHRRKSDGLPFYVGKGSDKRAWITGNRKSYWKSVVRKHGFTVEIVSWFSDEAEAYSAEVILIEELRSHGMPIVNFQSGGDRCSGWNHRKETISKMSEIKRHSKYLNHSIVYSSLKESFTLLCDAVDYVKHNGYPKATTSGILQALDKPNRTSYGRKWSRTGFPDHPLEVGSDRFGAGSRKTVVRSDGVTYSSAAFAARSMNEIDGGKRKPQSISNTCVGRQKSAYGYVRSHAITA